MGFVRIQKKSTYFKRFQVKFRRRREGKTDYKARRRLIQQDKNKFNAPKYRLVVRITNRDIICQVVFSKIIGDEVICAAYAHELRSKYGVKVGLTNYASCYATGLLVARRLLTKLGLAEKYEGVKEPTGAEFHIQPGERKPFKAVLDIGLAHTTTGARIFGALKGAVDGGLDVPHSPRRFPGFKDDKLDTAKHRDRILGNHVGQYMKALAAEDPAAFKERFSKYIENGLNGDKISALWKETHKKIRADPVRAKKEKKTYPAKLSRRTLTKVPTKVRHHNRDQRRAAFKRKAEASSE